MGDDKSKAKPAGDKKDKGGKDSGGKKGGGAGVFLVLLLLIAGGAGGYWYVMRGQNQTMVEAHETTLNAAAQAIAAAVQTADDGARQEALAALATHVEPVAAILAAKGGTTQLLPVMPEAATVQRANLAWYRAAALLPVLQTLAGSLDAARTSHVAFDAVV